MTLDVVARARFDSAYTFKYSIRPQTEAGTMPDQVAYEAVAERYERLVELQEFERKELARELHDRIGQSLTALNINLNMLGTELPPQASDGLRSRLADSEALIESTTAAIGDILLEHHPHRLDVVTRVTPVARSIDVSHRDHFLQSELYTRDRIRRTRARLQ